MFRLKKTIPAVLLSFLILFSCENTVSAGNKYNYLSKSFAFISTTKNFINADEKGFININSSSSSNSNSQSTKSAGTSNQNSSSSGVKSTINKGSKYKFQCGLAAVVVNNKVGYINKGGKFVIPAVYDDGTMFYEDSAFVKKGTKWALINNTGKLLTGFIFDGFDDANASYKDILINDYHGLLNSEGKLVVPPVYYGTLNVNDENDISLSTYDSLKKMAVESLIGSIGTGGEVSYNNSYMPFSSVTNSSALSILNSRYFKQKFPMYDMVWSLGNGFYCGYKASSQSYSIFDKTGKLVYTKK